ncbi:hypothetical protein DPMN_116996 [Dreissena polymorpha]|uniref:Uncharacterized protein n=1 Tax=Dreissena polymorpha TaxID=45954 RepID=A0A9D4QUG9_DREPO|nr:hypothetical protein DPMN_116996 [Dreissena polymorpha]
MQRITSVGCHSDLKWRHGLRQESLWEPAHEAMATPGMLRNILTSYRLLVCVSPGTFRETGL